MVYLYSKANCGPCELVKGALERKGLVEGVDWEEKRIDKDEKAMDEITDLGYMSVPLVVKDSEVLFNGFRPDIIEKVF